jgi:hypothetical protein
MAQRWLDGLSSSSAAQLLEDSAKSDDNISKMIVSNKVANGTPSYGMSQEVSLLFFAEQEDLEEHIKFSIIFI